MMCQPMSVLGPGTRSLVGRSKERRVLAQLLDAVRAGESRTLVITGAPGVGKTALLESAAESAPDVRFQRAVGVESEMELAFAGLHQLCAPLLERLGRLPEPQQQALAIALGLRAGAAPDRFLLGLAVLSLLSEVAAERPLLCVIDDAQWIDRASAQTFAFVARRVSAESLAIVFAMRDPADDLARLPSLELGGLDDEAARELLRSVVSTPLDERLRDRVIAETHGNPLALLELPRGMSAVELAGGFGLLEAQALTGRIEVSFLRRLSDDTRRLLLVAAAEPIGDPLLLLRACGRLGISVAAADLQPDGLLTVGERVAFRHPLVRSAVYRSATVQERRAVHLALAEETDAEADPDRRAWHLAGAAAGPDEQVALELERSAGRAQARGGVAAAAAFLRRAVALTQDPALRVGRALAAAQTSLYAGAFDSALQLLDAVESPDALQRARMDLLRAEIAFASRHGGEAPAMLLEAVQRIAALDAQLARAHHLEVLSAAMFAARLASPGGDVRDVARVVQAARGLDSAEDLLLDGWATLFADGCAAATPTLQETLRRFTDSPVTPEYLHLLWLVTITAPVVWDEARWDTLSRGHVELARSSGALSELPLALHSRSVMHLFRGELAAAGALIEQARVAIEATGAGLTPWGALALAALRGREPDALAMLDAAADDATRRGEGISLTVVAWARALLHNGLGAYANAFAAAQEAIDCPTNSAAAAWGMAELVEAAVRVGEHGAAAEAGHRFAMIAHAAGTDWALGVNARLRALVSAGEQADDHYQESLERLGRGQMRVDLARTQMLYGEWLRRENRRVDARAQLRTAHDQFAAIGLEAFTERARRELQATGETVRKRSLDTRDDLTPHERQIAELARDGLSNAEIGARLFISRRTVEWHLRHVFAKLEIRSRRELADALGRSELLTI